MTLALSLFLSLAHADTAAIGAPAPDFTLTDTEGKSHKLSDQKGNTVVLEWFNPGCPFVKYAHGSGPLKDLGNTWSGKGVRWYAVNSGAPGKQGAGLDTNKQAKSTWGMGYPVLLDESGTVGQAYGATSTPAIVVIDPSGRRPLQGRARRRADGRRRRRQSVRERRGDRSHERRQGAGRDDQVVRLRREVLRHALTSPEAHRG